MQPAEPETFGMFVADRWYRLRIRPELVPRADPVASLDVTAFVASYGLAENTLAVSFAPNARARSIARSRARLDGSVSS